jgi:hypothetical protein
LLGVRLELKQLSFQRFALGGEEGEETAENTADVVAARDVESILGLCNARGLPSAMLRWHYRSRHESLIATSNAEFYDGRLFVLPSPRARSATLGLSLRRVEGRFDTGGTGTNAEEARAVAEAVIAHARETPGDTLGVAAFSIRQRDAILNAIEAARRDNPDTEAFFSAHPDEPFFVKNLENVQGDEREGHEARHPLEGEHPVAGVGVLPHVALRPQGQKDPVERMKRQRQRDAEELDQGQTGNGLDLPHGVVERRPSARGRGVGPEVHDEKHADRDDPRQGVKPPQEVVGCHRGGGDL